MNEKIVNIAFTLASNRGAYAILLGSGVSRAADIPTGWEITLDLIKKYAERIDGVATSDPEEWYRTKFNEEPDYSDVLNRIFKTPTERSRAIKEYIEPKQRETEESKIVEPTKAHRAIARLVKIGVVKVIITTNFDRLMENALAELQITPQVITNSDSLNGSLHISHADSTLIKINGDYLDTRSKNTKTELNKYNRNLKKLLTEIVNNYGLIVCGWSGDWDRGLVDSLLAKSSRRYWMYWATKATHLSLGAKSIIAHQKADLIPNITADEFFTELSESVIAIVEKSQKNPLSIEIAVELTKKYLSEAKYYIKLHDLIMDETRELIRLNNSEEFRFDVPWSVEEFRKRVASYEAKCERLLCILVTCAYFGEHSTEELIHKSLNQLLSSVKIESGNEVYINLAKYPMFFIIYPVLISSLCNNKTNLFKRILVDIPWRYPGGREPCIFEVNSAYVFRNGSGSLLPGQTKNTPYPESQYLRNKLFQYVKSFLPEFNLYQEFFDRMEYYLALVYTSLCENTEHNLWVPLGFFVRRGRRLSQNESIQYIVTSEIKTLIAEHPLLKLGLFNSSYNKLVTVNTRLFEHIQKIQMGSPC